MDKALRYGAYAGVVITGLMFIVNSITSFSLLGGVLLLAELTLSVVFCWGIVTLGKLKNSNLIKWAGYTSILYNILSIAYTLYWLRMPFEESDTIFFIFVAIAEIVNFIEGLGIAKAYKGIWEYGRITGIVTLLFSLVSMIGLIVQVFIPSSNLITLLLISILLYKESNKEQSR